jgi:trehalose-6-phosphate synthase
MRLSLRPMRFSIQDGHELFGAILTNPDDPKSMTEMLKFALEMDETDAELRQTQLFEEVSTSDVFAWGEHFVDAAFADAESSVGTP